MKGKNSFHGDYALRAERCCSRHPEGGQINFFDGTFYRLFDLRDPIVRDPKGVPCLLLKDYLPSHMRLKASPKNRSGMPDIVGRRLQELWMTFTIQSLSQQILTLCGSWDPAARSAGVFPKTCLTGRMFIVDNHRSGCY